MSLIYATRKGLSTAYSLEMFEIASIYSCYSRSRFNFICNSNSSISFKHFPTSYYCFSISFSWHSLDYYFIKYNSRSTQIRNTMDLSELKYNITAFRTKKTYLIFLITQLILSLAIVCIALASNTHFRTPLVIGLQLVLFLSLAFDLLIVRWVSEGRLCSRKTNVFDFVLLCIFAATLVFLVLSSEDSQKDYRELLEVDDVLVIIIVITRYVVQVVRLIHEIRHTRTNRRLQSEIKKFNLNEMELHSTTFNDAFHIDNQIRAKITAFSSKKMQFVEDVEF